MAHGSDKKCCVVRNACGKFKYIVSIVTFTSHSTLVDEANNEICEHQIYSHSRVIADTFQLSICQVYFIRNVLCLM